MYNYNCITPASFQAIATSDLNLWLRLNNGTTENTILSNLILYATDQFYNDTQGCVLCSSTWTLSLDHWPQRYLQQPNPLAFQPEPYAIPWIWGEMSGNVPTIYLALSPVTAITSVQYLDPSSTAGNLVWDNLTGWQADLSNTPARVILPTSLPDPCLTLAPRVQVTFTAGYTSGNAPALAPTAIRLLASHWYANRETTGDRANDIPHGWNAIVSRFRVGATGNWNR